MYEYVIESKRYSMKIRFYKKDKESMGYINLINSMIKHYDKTLIDCELSIIFISFKHLRDYKYGYNIPSGENIESLAATVDISLKTARKILAIKTGLEEINENDLKLEII